MSPDLPYQLSLPRVPHIGNVHAKILVQHFGTAQAIFKAARNELEKIEGIGGIRATSIKAFNDFRFAEEEIRFLEKYRINALFLNDKNYPQRLLNCYDPPTILFYKGRANLNSSRMVAIVGTRKNTEYGKQATEKLVKELGLLNVIVISGLAFGIDAIAHKSSLKNNIPTIGVLGHGLDTIYPGENASLAKEMLQQGGLLTEFPSKTKPDKHNFPSRNRLVAGISDVTVVVETGIQGGSMITAEMANGYNRDVFAFPGKITDAKSSGCNHLIKTNKAVLLTDASELVEIMGWDEKKKPMQKMQKELFLELSIDERAIHEILSGTESATIDELNFRSELSGSGLSAAILSLELKNIIVSLPGKVYKLI